jgi:hypothetical protein
MHADSVRIDRVRQRARVGLIAGPIGALVTFVVGGVLQTIAPDYRVLVIALAMVAVCFGHIASFVELLEVSASLRHRPMPRVAVALIAYWLLLVVLITTAIACA